MRLHMRVLGHGGTSPRLTEDKPTYKEKFVPPEISMISYLMAKVSEGTWYLHGLVQEKRNSIALAMEVRPSCINPWSEGTWYLDGLMQERHNSSVLTLVH